jgi:hypothetical protein
MKRALITIGFVGLWVWPLVRAVHLFRYTAEVYAETGSLNAWTDYAFSRALLASYSFSLAVGVFLIWLFFRTHVRLLAGPLTGAFCIAGGMVLLRPEEVIVFFPAMSPTLPAAGSLIALLVAGVMLGLHRIRPQRVISC